MKRLISVISYDGSAFHGYQVQPNKRSVQAEIEAVLSKMHKGTPIRVFASGRTDAKVHAVGQVIHFDTSLSIPAQQWKKALNSLLPDDISIIDVTEVEDHFHARFNVVKKEYRYKMLTTQEPNVFKRHYYYHYPYQLDHEAITQAMRQLVGTYDFTSFCSAKTEIDDKVRTLYEVELLEEEGELIFRFVGNGFLYNMVRILVGTLLDVGRGAIKPMDIKNIIEKKDRSFAGKTVPGHGLYLWKVSYK